MTRGQIVVFYEEGIITTAEFNGSMYIMGGHGEEIVCALKKIHTIDEYESFVEDFNRANFEYQGRLFYITEEIGDRVFTEEELLDMRTNYGKKWHSDYLYFKNLRTTSVTVITDNGCVITVLPNGIAVLNFGKFNNECKSYNCNLKFELPERIINLCEQRDWTVHTEVDGESAVLEKYSPAGEDFMFTVSTANFIGDVVEYADDFDPDEHAEMWIARRGTRGIPSSIRELINDADAIKEMLEDLAAALKGKTL